MLRTALTKIGVVGVALSAVLLARGGEDGRAISRRLGERNRNDEELKGRATKAECQAQKSKEKAAQFERAQSLAADFRAPISFAQNLMDFSANDFPDNYVVWGETTSSGDLASSVRQGSDGNCSFLAALMGYARYNPADLKKRIRETKDQVPGSRTFKVQLYDYITGESEWIIVLGPTSEQRMLASRATDGSMWVTLFESAYVQLRSQQARVLNHRLKHNLFEEASDGSSLQAAIASLAGVSSGPLRPSLGMKGIELAELERLFSRVPDIVVTVGTAKHLSDAATKANLYPEHAYVVISYNKNILTLRNPHNSARKGGRIVKVSLEDFRSLFLHYASSEKP